MIDDSDHCVHRAGRQNPGEPGGDLGVAADQVARAGALGGQGLRDHVRGHLRRQPLVGLLGGLGADRGDELPVALVRLGRHRREQRVGGGGPAVPDRCRDRAGLDDAHLHGAAQLASERVAERLERVLRGRVRPVQRQRDEAGDRRDVHDPPAGAAQRRQAGLDHGELRDRVDLELAAQLVERHVLERARDRDPGVVDEPVEPLSSRSAADVVRVRDVERTGWPSPSPSRRVAHAGVDGHAALGEQQRRRATDPGRGAGDQHGHESRHYSRAVRRARRRHRGRPRACPGGSRRSSGWRRRCASWRRRSGSPGAGYLAGSPRQRVLGVGWASLRDDPPPPAAEPTLTVAEVDAALAAVAAMSGAGSVAARRAALNALLARATASEQAFLRALVLGDMRQGALAAVVGDAVAKAAGRAGRGGPAGADAARRPRRGRRGGARRGRGGAGRVPARGRPPDRADARPDGAGRRRGAGEDRAGGGRVEARRRAHPGPPRRRRRAGSSRARWTTSRRGCRRSSRRRSRCPRAPFVLDGEAIALREDGRPHPFQVTGSRFASRSGPCSLTPMFFDLLHLDGEDLLDRPGVGARGGAVGARPGAVAGAARRAGDARGGARARATRASS